MRARKSAKSEIQALMIQIMHNRPTNHPRVVVELNTIDTICQAMGWEHMRGQIKRFLDCVKPEIMDRGMNEGRGHGPQR